MESTKHFDNERTSVERGAPVRKFNIKCDAFDWTC